MVHFIQSGSCTLFYSCISGSGISSAGLPHSAIRGSQDMCSLPRLFAAYHGLPRPTAPRHPPWTYIRLTILSFPLLTHLRIQATYDQDFISPSCLPVKKGLLSLFPSLIMSNISCHFSDILPVDRKGKERKVCKIN